MLTWSLLVVLFAAIEDTSTVHLPDKPTLVDMKRRASLSQWLQVYMDFPSHPHRAVLLPTLRTDATFHSAGLTNQR